MPDRPAPSTRPLWQRLLIKPGHRVVVVGAPEGFSGLGDLPEGVEVRGGAERDADAVLAFVRTRADVPDAARTAFAAVKRDGLLWFAYPKKTGPIKSDLDRDHGWEAVQEAGFQGVAMISIDETWSAMRYRPKG